MIVRSWCGRAAASNQNAYPEHFRKNVLPDLHEIDGFLGASLLKTNRAEDVEYLVLTRWASMDAIRAFAGDEVQKAVVEPQAVAALLDFDRTVKHYEVVEEAIL